LTADEPTDAADVCRFRRLGAATGYLDGSLVYDRSAHREHGNRPQGYPFREADIQIPLGFNSNLGGGIHLSSA
jgi:hypothetical protein